MLLALPLLGFGQSTTVVISQVYTAGGNTNSVYKNDFIELHNVSGTAQSVEGWSVQYAGSGNTASWTAVALTGSIAPGGYYLVQQGGGTGGTTDLPMPNARGSSNLVTASGKVALVNTTATLPANCPSGTSIIDLVGYGSTTCAEGTAATYPSSNNTSAILRLGNGCTDSNNNSADFSSAPANPRNSSAAAFVCGTTAYYAKPSGDLNLLATYGNYPDGSGVAPESFTAANYTFTVAGTNRSFAANWVVSGAGAKVILAENASLVIPAGYTFTGTLDQLAGSTLIFKNTSATAYTNLTQGAQAASSTIDFAQAGSYILPDATQLKLQNLRLTGGAKTLARNYRANDAAGVQQTYASQSVPGNVVIDGATVNGFGSTPYSALDLGGNLTLLNGGAFATSSATRLALNLLGSQPQTFTGNGQDILLAELDAVTSGGGAVLADAGGTTHLELGGAAGGGYYLETGATLQLNTNSLRFLAGGKAVIFPGSNGGGQGTVTPTASSSISLETTSRSYLGTLRLTPGATTLNNLRVAAANDALALSSSLTVNGILNLEKGNLSLADNATFTLNGALSGTGLVQAAPGTSLVVGSGATGNLGFATGYQTLSSLTLNHSGNLTLASPLTVSGRLRLSSGILSTTATNLLSLGAGASLEGGSDASFIAGPLARTVGPVSSPTAVLFPVGKGSSYRPLTLNVATQTSTTMYRAEQLEGDPGQTLSSPDASGTNLARVSTVRSFTITPYNLATPAVVTQPTGFAGTLTISLGTDDKVADPAAPSLVVAKRADSSQPWANYGHASHSGTSSSGTLTSNSFSSFSDFALASTSASSPLPVQLTSFAATRTSAGPVALTWITASELHCARFEVERSLDGRTFAGVAAVAAQGSSTQAHRYAAHDAAAPTTALYYRLRQVDADGTAAYSAPALVAASSAAEVLRGANPVGSQLTFFCEQAGPYTVRTALGQALYQGTAAAGLTVLDVQSLAAGLYLLEVGNPAGRVVRRFIKQ